ncbi:hypothetical protein FACS189494_03990 [Spirochaetia bacterium]|nr:hypothetical protein FACS189494_03990 [Spirochaetia bacterium]
MKTKLCIVSILVLCAFYTPGVGAAETGKASGPALLQKEIQSAQEKLVSSDLTAQDKHDAYTKLGRLFRLAGNIEKAGEAWENAAFALPEKRDYAALLESAACSMAMGDWEKAEKSVKFVLLTVRGDKRSFDRAKYLNAQIDAFKTGNYVILNSYTDDPEYASVRPQLYYTLWKLSGDNEYKVKLITEYPESPEARSIFAASDANVVRASSSAYWMLFPGRENVHLEKTAISTASAPEAPPDDISIPALQTGRYNDQKNAEAQSKRLKAAGFTANIIKRTTSGSTYWVVTVPAGVNTNQTIIKLKDAGFESFPLL